MMDGIDIRLRDMTPAERRGFDHALDSIETWARQLEVHANTMPAIDAPATLDIQMKNSARMTLALTRALRLGFPPPPPPAV